MKPVFISRCLGAVLSASALQLPAAAMASDNEWVLHSFSGNPDGAGPQAGVIDVKGMLYGTTANGGANCGSSGCGTVFSLDPKTDAEKVLYSFCSQQDCADGWEPEAGLVDANNALYGMAYSGGADKDKACVFAGSDACGVVFSIDPATGAETVVHSFEGYRSDGANPWTSLIDVNGTLYGTTTAGGDRDQNCGGYFPAGCGMLFALDPNTGVETALHSFQDNTKDGYAPYASLIDTNGTLYGTTSVGGANTGCGNGVGNGCGTVFALDPKAGAESVLYSFCSQFKKDVCADGTWPFASLVEVNGMLYGTTWYGGVNDHGISTCEDQGCGTVFALDPTKGTETVLYAFCTQKKCADGALPEAGLIDVKGTLYGTSTEGGTFGGGTLFSLDPTTGKMTTLHAFGKGCQKNKCSDGYAPTSNLIDVAGTLYGTTSGGGTYMAGTVFAFKP